MVAGAVRTLEHVDDEIERSTFCEVARHPSTTLARSLHGRCERHDLLGVARPTGAMELVARREPRDVGNDVVDHAVGVDPHLAQHVVEELRWPGVRPVVPVVAAPLGQLHTIEPGTRGEERCVDDRDATAGVRDVDPERLGADALGDVVIRERRRTDSRVEAVTVHSDAGEDGRPDRTDVRARFVLHRRRARAREHLREVRQDPRCSEFVHQIRHRGIESEEHHRAPALSVASVRSFCHRQTLRSWAHGLRSVSPRPGEARQRVIGIGSGPAPGVGSGASTGGDIEAVLRPVLGVGLGVVAQHAAVDGVELDQPAHGGRLVGAVQEDAPRRP